MIVWKFGTAVWGAYADLHAFCSGMWWCGERDRRFKFNADTEIGREGQCTDTAYPFDLKYSSRSRSSS